MHQAVQLLQRWKLGLFIFYSYAQLLFVDHVLKVEQSLSSFSGNTNFLQGKSHFSEWKEEGGEGGGGETPGGLMNP